MDFPMPALPPDYNLAPEGAYGLDDGLHEAAPAEAPVTDPTPEETRQ